jgi:hypothetical protein
MKNLKFLGVLAMALVLSLSVFGCKDDDSPSWSPPAGGTLTITGLGSYNGKFVVASGWVGSTTIYAVGSLNADWSVNGAEITGGQAVLNVYNWSDDTGYFGSGTLNSSNVEIHATADGYQNSATPITTGNITGAVFASGVATQAFNP